MGCCTSLIPGAAPPFPKESAFFAKRAPPTDKPHLIDGLPTTLIVDAARIVATMQVGIDPSITANAKQRNDPAGIGSSQLLNLSDESGAVLAKLEVPPPRSFGIGAVLTDATGTKIALLRTASEKRPSQYSWSSYNVYAAEPLLPGQAPTPDGWYLWATVTRAPGTLSNKIFNPADVQTLKSDLHFGSGRYSLQTVDGEGVMLADSTKETPKKHIIKAANGADPALVVCIMYAGYLALDEPFDDGYRAGAGAM